MIAVVWLLGCVHSSAAAPMQARLDPAARMFALRAWRAEARGDRAEAERSWRWVARLDGGVYGLLHQADALRRLGGDPAPLFRAVLVIDPDSRRAQFGLALLEGQPLDRFLPEFACQLALAEHPERLVGASLCGG